MRRWRASRTRRRTPPPRLHYPSQAPAPPRDCPTRVTHAPVLIDADESHSGGFAPMRIAYIAPYQGPELLKRRPIVHNLALAGNVKVELIAELLRRGNHQVDVISQGAVVVQRFQFYGGFF